MSPFLIWNPSIKRNDPDWLRRDIRKDEDAFYAEYGAPTPLAWLRTRLQALSGSRALGELRSGKAISAHAAACRTVSQADNCSATG